MLPLVVVGCGIKSFLSVSAWSHRLRRGWYQPPRLAVSAERDYFTLREADHWQKQLEEPRSILMSSADRVAHIIGQLIAIVWAIHALAEYKCLSNKTDVFECLLGFCFNNIFCAATKFWLHRQFSSAQFRAKAMGDGFLWCYCCRFVWTVNVCWASCNKQGQRSSE